jgi:hypothetical protein
MLELDPVLGLVELEAVPLPDGDMLLLELGLLLDALPVPDSDPDVLLPALEPVLGDPVLEPRPVVELPVPELPDRPVLELEEPDPSPAVELVLGLLDEVEPVPDAIDPVLGLLDEAEPVPDAIEPVLELEPVPSELADILRMAPVARSMHWVEVPLALGEVEEELGELLLD